MTRKRSTWKRQQVAVLFGRHCLGNVIKGWDGYLNKPSKPQATLTQKKPRLYACERIFSASSVTSPLNKEDEAQNHPILKRKSINSATKPSKDIEKPKSNKKSSKYKKKLKSKSKKLAYDSSSDLLGLSVGALMKEENSGSMDNMSDIKDSLA
eukprot:TRINITY_DN6412_c0_g1_i10.p1 TRINITY_DN6412_c0_g1~~TRINITY_DN6412_c0_g1_i10.p1  ORF type:complete len:153 (-),score=45.00 TRINITY_DN6412_c0_g1_i10:43-501(-)